MKIGIVVDNELNNDIRVLREIEILRESGNEIFVLCFGFDKNDYKLIDSIHITRINIRKKVKDILFFLLNLIPAYEWLWSSRIRKFIIDNGIEAIHVHDLYMAKNAHNGIMACRMRIPLVLDLHENYPYSVTTYNWTKGLLRSIISRPEAWRQKEHEYLGYADRIIVLSENFRDLLIDRYNDLSIAIFTVLPNVPDISLLKKEKSSPIKSPFSNDFPIILYYGVIAERRGVFDAIDMFTGLIKDNYRANLLFIGPVDKKDIVRFQKEISADLFKDRIMYIPWIDSKDLPAYLEIIDICIAPFHKNPQHESGVANKIYEYMLGGKPIVASNCKPQQEIIEKHNCGLIFDNMTEFKGSIIILLKDIDLRALLGRNGNEAIIKEYNTGVVKGNLIKMYQTI